MSTAFFAEIIKTARAGEDPRRVAERILRGAFAPAFERVVPPLGVGKVLEVLGMTRHQAVLPNEYLVLAARSGAEVDFTLRRQGEYALLRASLAHALGHLVLHDRLTARTSRACYLWNPARSVWQAPTDAEEWAATIFAAELLVPLVVFGKWHRESGLSPEALAAKFGVPPRVHSDQLHALSRLSSS